MLHEVIMFRTGSASLISRKPLKHTPQIWYGFLHSQIRGFFFSPARFFNSHVSSDTGLMITLWILSKVHTLFWAYKDRTARRWFLRDPAVVDLKAVNSFKTTAINGNSVLTSALGHLLRDGNGNDGCWAACVFGFRRGPGIRKCMKNILWSIQGENGGDSKYGRRKWKLRAEFMIICVGKTQPRRFAKKKHTDIKLIMACRDKNKKHWWLRAIDVFSEEFPLIKLISLVKNESATWKCFLLNLQAWVKFQAAKDLFFFLFQSTEQWKMHEIRWLLYCSPAFSFISV